MKMPSNLSNEGKKFWQRHAKNLVEENILTDRDYDSFVLLCKIHGMIQSIDGAPSESNSRIMSQFINLTKQYQSLAKQFGLLPRERKFSGFEKQEDITTAMQKLMGDDA